MPGLPRMTTAAHQAGVTGRTTQTLTCVLQVTPPAHGFSPSFAQWRNEMGEALRMARVEGMKDAMEIAADAAGNHAVEVALRHNPDLGILQRQMIRQTQRNAVKKAVMAQIEREGRDG